MLRRAAVVSLLLAGTALGIEGESILLNEIARTSNQSLLWGPYRPNLYFGVKPRLPNSFLAGLMWSKVDDYSSVQYNFRHQCEQGDNMAGYDWEEYDVRNGGSQVIRDQNNKIDIHTEFVKVDAGQNGGNWGVRIKGVPREDAPMDLKSTVIFYVGAQGIGSIALENEPDPKGLKGIVKLSGSFPELGDFELQVTPGPDTNAPPSQVEREAWDERPLDRTIYNAVMLQAKDVWKAKDAFFLKLRETLQELSEKYERENHPPPWQTFTLKNEYAPGNLHFIQKVFEGPFEFDVLYSSASAPAPMTSEILTERIESVKASFLDRFDKIFKRQSPFDIEKYKKFAHTVLSNLLGGIGYFHGTSIVDRSYAPEYDEEDEGFWEDALAAQKRPGAAKEEGPSELFSSIPSRPFFPRGFYWDEGFHLIPISEWDMDLTLNIVKSWFALMDDDGWIGREQILGDEARSKVPEEFQVQYPHYANPPTLFFILTKFIDTFEKYQIVGEVDESLNQNPTGISPEELPESHLKNPEAAIAYLREIYPRLRRHYYWFRSTQAGDMRTWERNAYSSKEGYRWRGRTPEHILTSGLDDYPRALPPHTGELHVDLLSWVGMMTRCIKRIAEKIDEKEDATEFAKIEDAITRNVDDLHWSETHSTYCDVTIDDFEESSHVCHKGYISIFPFLVGLVDKDSDKLGKVLDLIEDPNEMWSDYGLRSLSKSDEYFGTGENYWKGPIWVNINYLAVQRLLEYGSIAGPHQKQAASIYERLRKNIVENVFREWEKTAYAWEQYDSVTGKGQRTAHFLGWTSLVLNMMSMPEKATIIAKPQINVKDEL